MRNRLRKSLRRSFLFRIPHPAFRITEHRPWPLPRGPWVMAQTWYDLLFAHWPVPLEHLRALVPPVLPVDTFDGQAWVGVVPFGMRGVRPRGVPPIPGFSAFPELNVRTYVTLEDKPGVFFFSLDAANPVAVVAARALYSLPYFWARMSLRRAGAAGEWVDYASRRLLPRQGSAWFRGRYRPTGEAFHPERGSLEDFLTERYCLYTVDRRGRAYRADIHHPPWPLQAAEAEFRVNTMARAHGVALPETPPLLHFAPLQQMVAWPIRRVI